QQPKPSGHSIYCQTARRVIARRAVFVRTRFWCAWRTRGVDCGFPSKVNNRGGELAGGSRGSGEFRVIPKEARRLSNLRYCRIRFLGVHEVNPDSSSRGTFSRMTDFVPAGFLLLNLAFKDRRSCYETACRVPRSGFASPASTPPNFSMTSTTKIGCGRRQD